MSEKFAPAMGDRVRVVLEGYATGVERGGSFNVGPVPEWHVDQNCIDPGAKHVVSIEKVDPPVEVFKPGDVVRSKAAHRFLYTVAQDGWYYDHIAKRVFKTGIFDSDNYERVTLVEPPL